MNNQILLELKQQNAITVNTNGDYTNVLKKSIEINEGDILNLNSAYIDTVLEDTNNIILENDIQIKFTFGYYMINAFSSDDNKRFYANYTNNNYDFKELCDAKPYILCQNTSGKPSNDYQLITIQIIEPNSKYIPKGKIRIYFQYENMNGKTIQSYVNTLENTIPGQKQRLPINVIAKKDTYKLLENKGQFKQFFKDDGFQEEDINVNEHFEPFLDTLLIKIPAGIYTQSQIAQIINDKVDVNNYSPITDNIPVKNPLLRPASGIYNHSLGGVGAQHYYFIDLDEHKNLFTLQNAANYSPNVWYGTNQFDLEYDNIQQKFYFKYTHFPLYTKDADIFTSFSLDKRGGDTYYPFGSYSGVYFTNIESDDDFFEKELGFDFDNELILNLHNESYTAVTTIGNAASHVSGKPAITGYDIVGKFPNLKLELNKHITSGFYGLDSGVLKIDGSKPIFYKIPSDITTIQSTTSETFTIYASNSTQLEGQTIPYYLIEVSIPYNNNLINDKDIKKNIYGIVNKYYSLDSYTSKEGSNIIYEHIGAANNISQIGIRILNPDYSIASLGPDNTVFLTLQKASINNKKK